MLLVKKTALGSGHCAGQGIPSVPTMLLACGGNLVAGFVFKSVFLGIFPMGQPGYVSNSLSVFRSVSVCERQRLSPYPHG